MQFMLLVLDRTGAPGATIEKGAMKKFADELAQEGKLKGAMSLHPRATGARVQVREGTSVVTEGPYPERQEAIVAALAIETANRAEAIAIAKRCVQAHKGAVEMRLMPDRDVAKAGHGTQFVFLLHTTSDEVDPDGSKYREMIAYDGELKREGSYVESSQLAREPSAARIEPRDDETLVTDGPFAETKEFAGGYYLVEAASRAQAVEIAKRCPHAKWGSIEVRQVI